MERRRALSTASLSPRISLSVFICLLECSWLTDNVQRVLERIRKFKSRPSQDDLQEIVSAASLHASKVDPTAKYGPHRADITPDKVDRKLRSLMKRHKRIQKKMTDKKLTSDQLGGKEKHSFDCGNLVLLIEKELKMNKGEAKGKGTTEKKAEGRKEQAADEMEASDHEDSREESVDLEKEAAQEGVEGVEEENEEHEGGEREDVEQEHSEHEDAEQENGEHEDAEQEKGEEEDVQEKESEQEGLQEKESEQEDLQEKESEEKDVQQKESEKEDAETESDEENAEQEAPKKKYQLRKTHDVKSLKAKNEEDAKAAPLTPGKKARLVGNVPVVTTPGSGRGRRLNTTLITSAFQSQLNFVKEFDRLPNETELSEILHKAYHFALESDPEGKHGTHRESPPDIKSFVAKRRSILKAFKTMKNQQMAGRGISNRKDLTKSELSTIECANIINEIDVRYLTFSHVSFAFHSRCCRLYRRVVAARGGGWIRSRYLWPKRASEMLR